MKNLKKFAPIVLSFFIAAGSVFAGTGDKDKKGKKEKSGFAYGAYVLKNTDKIRFAFENQNGENVSIRIYNNEGNEVFSEHVTAESGKKNYDLSALKKGEYRLKIRAGSYTDEQVLVLGEEPAGEFAAYISQTITNNSLTVACENIGEELSIRLLDENEAVLYSESHSGISRLGRKLNLNELKAGTYTLEVVSGDKTVQRIYTVK